MTAIEHPRARQRATALAKANSARFQSSRVKQDLKGLPKPKAWRMAADLLRDCPPAIQHMRLLDFLEAVPGVGEERIRLICQQHPSVWPLRRIGALTENERARVAERVCIHGGWGPTQREIPVGGLNYAA